MLYCLRWFSDCLIKDHQLLSLVCDGRWPNLLVVPVVVELPNSLRLVLVPVSRMQSIQSPAIAVLYGQNTNYSILLTSCFIVDHLSFVIRAHYPGVRRIYVAMNQV